jgi:hypothetical protein
VARRVLFLKGVRWLGALGSRAKVAAARSGACCCGPAGLPRHRQLHERLPEIRWLVVRRRRNLVRWLTATLLVLFVVTAVSSKGSAEGHRTRPSCGAGLLLWRRYSAGARAARAATVLSNSSVPPPPTPPPRFGGLDPVNLQVQREGASRQAVPGQPHRQAARIHADGCQGRRLLQRRASGFRAASSLGGVRA